MWRICEIPPLKRAFQMPLWNIPASRLLTGRNPPFHLSEKSGCARVETTAPTAASSPRSREIWLFSQQFSQKRLISTVNRSWSVFLSTTGLSDGILLGDGSRGADAWCFKRFEVNIRTWAKRRLRPERIKIHDTCQSEPLRRSGRSAFHSRNSPKITCRFPRSIPTNPPVAGSVAMPCPGKGEGSTWRSSRTFPAFGNRSR